MPNIFARFIMSLGQKRTTADLSQEKCVPHNAAAETFCMTCKAAICLECIKGPRHFRHSTMSIINARDFFEHQFSKTWNTISDKASNLAVQEILLENEGKAALQEMLVEVMKDLHESEAAFHKVIHEFTLDASTELLRIVSMQQSEIDNNMLTISLQKQEQQHVLRTLSRISVSNGALAAGAQVLNQVNELLNSTQNEHSRGSFAAGANGGKDEDGRTVNGKRMKMDEKVQIDVKKKDPTQHPPISTSSFAISTKELHSKMNKFIEQRWNFTQQKIDSISAKLKAFGKNQSNVTPDGIQGGAKIRSADARYYIYE